MTDRADEVAWAAMHAADDCDHSGHEASTNPEVNADRECLAMHIAAALRAYAEEARAPDIERIRTLELQVRAYRGTVVMAGPCQWRPVEGSDPVEMPTTETLAALIDERDALRARLAMYADVPHAAIRTREEKR